MVTKKEKMHSRWHDALPEEFYEHAKAARREIHKSFEALFPPEFVEHRKAARKEMLLAFQKVINQAIEHLEEDSEESA